MLDDADHEDEIESAVRIRQASGLLVAEQPHVPHAGEPELLDLGADDGHEGGIGVEGRDLPHLGLLGQVLRDVAERAADLEHREAVPAPRAQVGEEPGQEVPAPRLLEGKVLRSAQGTLALHEHAHHARAVRGGIVPPGDREHASVAQVLEAVGGLFRHAPQDSSAWGLGQFALPVLLSSRLAAGPLSSKCHVLGRQHPSTYTHVRLGVPPPSGVAVRAEGQSPEARPELIWRAT